jgi:hypothetical protein
MSDAIGADAFGIDRASAIRKVTLAHNRFIRTQETKDEVTFGYVRQLETVERLNGDPGAVGSAEAQYATAGQISWTDAQSSVADFTTAVAQHLFDRYGRGLITGRDARGLRGGSTDGAKLGDEASTSCPISRTTTSGSPTISRSLGARCKSYATWTPVGYPLLKLADSDRTRSRTRRRRRSRSRRAPTTRAPLRVTITNAATLNAASAGLRLQMAVTTGADAGGDGLQRRWPSAAGGIPTTVRSRCRACRRGEWCGCGRRRRSRQAPSTFSSAANVTLSLPPPTSLSVTPSGTDGSIARVTWTPGDATSEIDVYLRSVADPSSAERSAAHLPPSSSRFTLEGLTPAASYTVTVQA